MGWEFFEEPTRLVERKDEGKREKGNEVSGGRREGGEQKSRETKW